MLPLGPRSRLLVVVFLSLFLLSSTIAIYDVLHKRPLGNHGPTVPSTAILKHQADLAALQVDISHSQPSDISDFGLKGYRVSLLASIARILSQDNRLDHERLRTLLNFEFPWWHQSHTGRIPWIRQAHAKARPLEDGIVLCAGSKNFLLAAHLIRTLRNVLHSTLPIQVAFAGNDDLPVAQQEALRGLSSDVETINLLDSFDEAVTGLAHGGHAQKPFAAIASRFDNVILVDADVIFLQNPDQMLHTAGFEKTGTMFYHDRAYAMAGSSRLDWVRAKLNRRTPRWNITESLFFDEDLWQEMESCVVGFDKSRPEVFMGLLFSAWMNTKVVREQETYMHVLGDKETYWLAAELSSMPYYFQSEYAGVIGALNAESEPKEPSLSKICSAHIAHMDGSGEQPLWFNGGLRLNKALKGNHTLASLTHFITAGRTMSDQPAWWYDSNDVWCARGRPPTSIVGKGLEPVIQSSLQEARNVDAELGTLLANPEG